MHSPHRIGRHLRAAALLTTATSLMLATCAGTALADGGGGVWSSCSNAQAGCTVSAGIWGQAGSPTAGGSTQTAPPQTSAGTAAPVCTSSPFTPSAADLTTLDQQYTPGTGHWEIITCGGPDLPTKQVLHWVANGAPPLPDPEVLAAQAEAKLTLPSPSIQASPALGVPQVVQLPTWTWLPQAQWTALSATAAVPGESVTATASPASVTWTWGDGTSSVCQGPGTAFTADVNDPSAPSPTCGHTYHVTSAQAPDQQFAVTATVSWTVEWSGAGAGASGTFPDLTTSSTVHWTVAQIQSVQINPGS
jgi:hypothetical protein